MYPGEKCKTDREGEKKERNIGASLPTFFGRFLFDLFSSLASVLALTIISAANFKIFFLFVLFLFVFFAPSTVGWAVKIPPQVFIRLRFSGKLM